MSDMAELRKEHEIISKWHSNNGEPQVSICCLCYNHELYIEDALEGFLSQVTNFAFEILIHDDASTDRSSEIIRAYEARYPRIIKAICQTENQYSKGVKVSATYNFSRAQGQFIAMCEGDDYWTDKDKLQIQVDTMINRPELSGSFHMVKFQTFNTFSGFYYQVPNKDIVSTRDIILQHYIPTAAVVYRKEMLLSVVRETPQLRDFPVGDIPLSILLSKKGKILFINKVMGVYRNNPTSLTHDQKHLDESRKRMIGMYITMLSLLECKDYAFVLYRILRLLLGYLKWRKT